MKAKIKAPRQCAFTLVEMVITVAIVGLLAVIAFPNFVVARDNSRLSVIRRNLRQVEEAKEQWATEKRMGNGALVLDMTELNPYLRGGHVVQVMNETYLPNPVGTAPGAALPPGVKLGPYAPGATIIAP